MGRAAWNPNVALANGATPPPPMRYLYITNPSKGRVDVYDNAFHPVDLDQNGNYSRSDVIFGNEHRSDGGRAFEDPQLPGDYVPFTWRRLAMTSS
jgi:hypothetical protein